MRRSSKRFSAALLVALLTATTVFGDVQTVRAMETVAVTEEAGEVTESQESSETQNETSETKEEQSSSSETAEAATQEKSSEEKSSVEETITVEETTTEETTTTEEETTEQAITFDSKPAFETITVKEARKAAGSAEVTVKGIITFIDGKNVYIQDETAGIDVFFQASAQKDLVIGDTITVKGVRAAYKGLEEITGTDAVNPEILDIEKATDNQTLPVKEVTVNELLTDYAGEGMYEATRVLVKNVTLGAINPKGNTVLTAEDGSTINAYRLPALKDITEGATVDMYAVVGDFNGCQLRVAKADDVILVSEKKEESTLYDPITDEMIKAVEGAVSVKDAAALTSGEATVVGQVVYKYVSRATDTYSKNIILEDVIDGKIYGYLIYDYDHADSYKAGNIVAVKGTALVYNGVPELKNVTEINVLDNVDAIEAQEVTISQLGADYLSEYVYIKDVELGEYNANGATKIKDATGSCTIYNAVAYPDDVTAGSVVDMYAACSAYNTAYQLRNETSADYKVKGGKEEYKIDDSLSLTVASFAGSAEFDSTTVNGDLYDENDFLAKDTTLKVSDGQKPLISNTSTQTGGTTHSIGTKGLAKDQYYLIETKGALYGNLNLSFFMKGSNTGAKNFVLEYSKDGENFEPAAGGTLYCKYTAYGKDGSQTPVEIKKEIKNGAFSLQTAGKMHEISINLPKEANNAEKLYIRLRVADGTSIKGAAIGSGGTNYFNGITLKANPLVMDSACNYVTVSPKAGETSVGQELTFETETENAKIYYAFDGSEEFKEYNADSKPAIEELPCRVTVYAAKEGKKDSLKLTYKFTQSQVATVKASPNGGAVALNSKVKLTCETEDAKILYAFAESEEIIPEESWMTYEEAVTLKELPCTMAVKAVKEGFEDSAVKTLSFTQRTNDKYNIYFGQMHAHTNYSDGSGSCEEAFAHAKGVDNLDFLCITDHSNSFDNCDSANINDGSMSEEWTEGHDLAKKYTDENFVGIMGFEMTWSNGLGHMNTFNSNGFQSRTQADYKTYATALNNYYNTLQTAPDSINQFNHPGTTFGDFQDFAYYSVANDNLITLIEVGNGEGAIGSSGYFPSYEYYQRALDKGWHVSPTNNQDNHKGKWGNANTARSVVLADSLTEENIYDAMRNNRVYATEDNDLSIYYTLDGNVMGSILDKDLTGDKVTLNVDLSDPTDSNIGTVQVVTNGGIVLDSKNVDTNQATVTFEVDNKYSYYYIKIVEADKDIAVTAPVWVGNVEAVGINGLSTTTKLPIKDEAIDVTLDLYNNEKTDLVLQSIRFMVDGKEVKTVDLENEGLTKVASEQTASYSFNYTYDRVGAMTMDVEVKATLNGVEKVYTDKLQLTYVSNDLVTHVVIDGSHYNDYVKGYYGGNMGNFITMAAEKNVKAEIVTEKFTEDTLKDADMLIVSAPAKKSGTANAGDYVASAFEDSFLEIVKEYVANGGTVIVCGLADYQDSTSGQTATETNKLLEAIGATIRMNSDEAIDKENNGGQEYRMYFKNFNMENPYMKGIKDGQTYSAYSGCTVDITNADENDTVYAAEALVRGYETTYSKNCKNDDGTQGDNAVAVEKGNVVALAGQKTKAGGMIFVGGTVFMSDFEVKAELDNNDSLPYANYTLMNNILESIKVVMPTTAIAEVRKGKVGDPFAIEGYVANGTDNEKTKFFDTIYVEDATGGITVFPFATAGVKKGTKIRLVGYLDEYQGDIELQITSYEILDEENLKEIKPTLRTTKDATNYDEFGGSFTQVVGQVTRIEEENGVISEFWVKDNSGVEAAVFIDGYIYSGTTGKNTLASIVKVGNYITAAGFLYLHPEGSSDVSVPVLRVPDCDEIYVPESVPATPSDPSASIPATPTVVTKIENTVSTVVSSAGRIIKKLAPIFAPHYNAEMENHSSLTVADQSLRFALVAKYYTENNIPMNQILDVFSGSNVGFSFLGLTDAAVRNQMEMNLNVERIQLPINVYYFKPEECKDYGFTFLMHMNVEQKNSGKNAKIFKGSLAENKWELLTEMPVNEIGNVAVSTHEMSEIIVLIED